MKNTTLLSAHILTRRACFWAASGLLAALVFGPPPAQGAVTEAWVQRYNNVLSNSYDEAFKVVRDAAGDIIVTGITDDGTRPDMLTFKYAGTGGSVLWQRRYHGGVGYGTPAVALDGSGNVIVTGSATIKYLADGTPVWTNAGATALAVDGNGNVVLTSSGAFYTTKRAAADGALLWEQRYNNPANDYGSAQALVVDAIGNVMVTGVSGNGTNRDFYTAKYATADGSLVWERRYNGPANGGDGASAVALDSNGNVVVTGASQAGSFYYSERDYYTAKYAAADGALLWERRYNGPANGDDLANAVAVDSSDNVVVTGISRNGGNGSYDCYTAKYAAANGVLLWEKRYDSGGYDTAHALALDGSDNVVVTGSSGADYYTAKYASVDGALLWEQRYSNGNASALAVDVSGNVVVTGSSGADYYTAKYASVDGALLWEKGFNGSSYTRNFPTAVALDHGGNVVVTGSSDGTNATPDYYTAKYSATNGALLWEKRYNGPAYQEDYAPRSSMAVDGSGNVVVTGYTTETNNFDCYTAKFAATDGALLWEQRYDSGGYDVARALALDGCGNVVITGQSYTDNSYGYTAKYAAEDGALLWEQRSDGGSEAMAMDGSGNVIVTGSATIKYLADGTAVWTNAGATALTVDGNGNVVVAVDTWNGNNSDYYTAKYAAADGALLWEQFYNGPENANDIVYALAVDKSGNVVVTGNSRNSDFVTSDYYTAKYAAADGALLWERRADAMTYYATPNAVAVDDNGNVVMTAGYYTAKYAAADGALVWEEHHNGLAVHGSHSLALGPNGMIAIASFLSVGSAAGDYVTVVYRENLPPVSIVMIPSGVHLRFTGVPGRSYTIERAPAVTGPWTPINNRIAPTSGLLEYLDALPPPSQAFYRAVQP